jgi:hypothetical protein
VTLRTQAQRGSSGDPTVLFNTVLFTGNANPVLAQQIASHLGVELGQASRRAASPTVKSPSKSARTCAPATSSWCSQPARRPTRT